MSLTRHLVRSPLDKKLMIPLAYINVRPFLFVGGRPLFVGIVLLAGCLIGPQWQRGPVSLISAQIFTGLFTLFLTGFGPFAGKEEIRDGLVHRTLFLRRNEGITSGFKLRRIPPLCSRRVFRRIGGMPEL